MDQTSRREFLRTTGQVVAGAAVASAVGGARAPAYAAATDRPPNVVLIMTDDQGYGDLGRHGNDQIRTPNLDRLHDESVRFERFYVCPVCSPTRACLMTGRYNYRTGAIDTYRGRSMMYPDEVTLAEMLSAAGYATGIFGKWHLGDNYPMRATDQGFQESLVIHGGGLNQPSDPPGSGYYNPILMHNGELTPYEGYCTDIYTDAAIDFIGQHRDDPFFVYLPTNAPHTPLVIDDALAEPYRAMGLSDDVAHAYAMITNIDDNVGKLLGKLDEFGVADNTIVLFLTDNGPQGLGGEVRYNAGMRGSKGTVYEGGVRVPLFVRWPEKLKAGKVVDRIAAHIDIAPTLLEACGVAKSGDVAFDGRSLWPLLTGEAPDWSDRNLYFQWHRGDAPEPYNNCAVRTQQYKLVNGVELYDLEEDPAEMHNIAAEHPGLVIQLRHAYEAWFDDVCATRGFLPPRIVIGDPHSGLTRLTLQDQRAGEGGGYGIGGFWAVRVARPGVYQVKLDFDDQAFPGQAHFQLGGTVVHMPLKDGELSCTFPNVRLPDGPGSVRAWVSADRKSRGTKFVEIHRVE